jgi:hypothetical protein
MRVFTETGVDRFRQYISDLKTNPRTVRPDLNIDQYSFEFQPAVEIDENRTFQTKLEIAEYMKNQIERAGIRRERVIEERNLWTWLAYIWFEKLCEQRNAVLIPREIVKYICNSDYRDYYRHLVAGPFSIYSLHGREQSLLFLHNIPYQHNDFVEQIASRQKIISHRNLIQVLHHLYWNTNSTSPKRGSQSRQQPCNLRRFIKLIDQFELTYNIYTMDSSTIMGLLPAEFTQWINR